MDCGAYIGDTLQEFIMENKTPAKYFGFEPNPENFKKAQAFLSVTGIEGTMFNAGVARTSSVMRFSSGNGGGSHIAEDGDLTINTLSLDDTIDELVTLIKMDVEGSEYDALKGATFLIGKYKPKLAISIYHKVGDYRKIPLLIKKLNPDYSDFYIRYLSPKYLYKKDGAGFGFIEVVLFAR